MKLDIPDPDNPMAFYITLTPRDGYWKGATFKFKFEVPDDYPYKPPKIVCLDKASDCTLSLSFLSISFLTFASFSLSLMYGCCLLLLVAFAMPHTRFTTQISTYRALCA